MQSKRTREALAARKSQGRRFTRIAPFGYRWHRRGKGTVMVAVDAEQRIMRHVAEMRTSGYSIDEIRQYMAYEWQVRNRAGNSFGAKEIRKMAERGAQLLRAEKLEVG